MRLDNYLVSKGYFSTRQKAKESIKRGHVAVNGKKVIKPSLEVKPSSKIEIFAFERPKGYWKLKNLDDYWGLLKKNYIVLDIGSSSGGFLLYSSEKSKKVYGIEFSKEFEGILNEIEDSSDNVTVFIDDAFTFDLEKLKPEKFDIIFDDLTLDANSSLKALNRFLPLLKKNGRALFVLKTGIIDSKPDFNKVGLKIIDTLESMEKKEKYFLLAKILSANQTKLQ